MKKFGKWIGALVVGAILGSAAIGLAQSGFLTNGLPTAGPTASVNGTTTVFPSNVVSEMGSAMMIPVDTKLANGQVPQSVGATVFQVAAFYADLAGNTATSTAGAATLNTRGGIITTESLSTAVGATYSFVLTNSLITATGPAPQVAMYSKTNTGGAISLTSVTNASGSSTIVFTNTGSTAFNGTMTIAFHI